MASVKKTVVHIYVYYLRSVLHLLAGYCNSLVITAFTDKTEKFSRACHIAPLPYIYKIPFGNHSKHLKS